MAVAGAVLCGVQAQASTPIDLSTIAEGSGGFAINGIGGMAGRSVSAAGDVNGDGLADVIVGARFANPGGNTSAGRSYVVFGKADGTVVNLSAVTSGTGGFVINGIESNDRSGHSVSGAGDVNGDGFADIIVGAYWADRNGDFHIGESYVVFGKADGTAVELSAVASGTGGFVLRGVDGGDYSGWSVSGAGDVNGDGLADLIVGAWGADGRTGKTYVIFGKTSTAAVDLATVESGTGGFVIYGPTVLDESGYSVSGAGDVNGDGLADLIVGAPGDGFRGKSYVVFGKETTDAVSLGAVELGSGGFAINGIDFFDRAGQSVSGAGDVNGDGLADVIVGSLYTGPDATNAGKSFVVFGKTGGTEVELSDVASGNGGFVINGIQTSVEAGHIVSAAGDVNGDGFADVIIGAHYKSGGSFDPGNSYLVFGKANGTAVELSSVASGVGGILLYGSGQLHNYASSVSGAGDVNGDGLADFIVGARRADGESSSSGQSYVVFSPETAPPLATYKAKSRAGDGAGGDPVVPTVFEDGRITVDYSDNDSAHNGSGGASIETVSIHRSLGDLSGLPVAYADTYWEWLSDRQNWNSAAFTLRYADFDMASLPGAEAAYTVYTATSKSGPWSARATTVDVARNTVSFTLSGPAGTTYMAITGAPLTTAWVDFAFVGSETGLEANPYTSLQDALDNVVDGGTIAIKGDTATSTTSETLTSGKAVTITAVNGAVTIGSPAARNAQDRTGAKTKGGFVSGSSE